MAQLFPFKEVLYSTDALAGWYTGSEYSPVATHGDAVFFVYLDPSRKPMLGKTQGGQTVVEPLEKQYPNYTATDDGHHEFSLGIDEDGYIHVTGNMHNFPEAEISPTLPDAYKNANMLYWKSAARGDISNFRFIGLTPAETMPGECWSYGRFTQDRNGKLFYHSRVLARARYYQNGGRGLGIFSYDVRTQRWHTYGAKAPISDSSYKVVAWELSGQNGGSYQQYKADLTFDPQNRMYITTGMNTQNGPAQVNSIVFAWSDDGGQTFKRANGAAITLPMQIAAGPRQGDVVDSDPPATFEQPSVTYAFDGRPVVHYTAGGLQYFKYWTGTAWSARQASPIGGARGRLLFNDYEQQLYFIHIHSGTLYARSTFTGANTLYDAGETFRYFDVAHFRRTNVLHGISWKASTGRFEVLQLRGQAPDTTGPTALAPNFPRALSAPGIFALPVQGHDLLGRVQ